MRLAISKLPWQKSIIQSEEVSMALIECYECGKKISDTASSCPSCGAIVKMHDRSLAFALSVKGLLLNKRGLLASVVLMICVAIAIISYFTYFSLRSEKLEGLVITAVQEKLNYDLYPLGIRVEIPSVEVTHVEGRKYKGLAVVLVEGSTHEASISIVDADSGIEWKEMPGEFIFLAPYMLKKALSPILDSGVKENISSDIVSEYKPASKVDGWSVQVASLSKSEVAISLVKKLRLGGYTVYIKDVDGMSRVFVGPVAERAEADRLRDQLEQQQRLNGFVVLFQGAG